MTENGQSKKILFLQKINHMKIKLLLFVLLFTSISFSQTRVCGMEEKMEALLFNPLMKQKFDAQQLKSEQELVRLQSSRLANGNSTNSNPVRIPVAVHFPNAGAANATLRNCLRALVQNQIDILNEDYNAQNADLINWTDNTSFNYPGVNYGSLNVQMELATQNHPAVSGLANGEVAVTFGYNYGDTDLGSGELDWDTNWAGYLNIVVRNDLGSTLGYAYLASDPADGAAIFMNNAAFGSVGNGCAGYMPGAPYNLGRTLTHELGHYFNLRHIWGSGFCGNDFVADTPQHNTSNGGCPPSNHLSTCPGTPLELTMNYMDYTNDACMYMFTAGQALRQQAHFNTIVNNFNETTLSNNDFDKKNSFTLYPNPNKGDFTILFADYLSSFSVNVVDQSGRIVFDKKYDTQLDLEQNISLENIASGIYFVKVSSDQGTMVKKIVVE